MKKLALIFLTFIALTSCSNKKVSFFCNNNNDLPLVENDSISVIDSLKQFYTPIIDGIWVLTDYINEIEKTKSPIKSRHKLDDIVTMVINAKNQSDSIKIYASVNNHEVIDFIVYFQMGQKSNSLKTNCYYLSNSYELGYETINDENYLFLYCYSKKNELIGKTQFSKVAEYWQNNNETWGLQYIVNKKLLAGNFVLIDNTKKQIKFDANGSVTGFKDFNTYKITTDFLGDPIFLENDIIHFRNEKHDITEYAFKINGDTICLYSVISEEETGLPFALNELKYKLVRK